MRLDLKRPADLLLSALGLVVLAPVLAAVAAAVAIALGRPVLFRQIRPGLHGKPFRLVKFRTMLDSVGADGKPLDDAQRLTRFGRFLRASSLDELPDSGESLKGEMSLSAASAPHAYLPLYSPEQARRHDVRPGITAGARSTAATPLWPEKLASVWYVDHRSFGSTSRYFC